MLGGRIDFEFGLFCVLRREGVFFEVGLRFRDISYGGLVNFIGS